MKILLVVMLLVMAVAGCAGLNGKPVAIEGDRGDRIYYGWKDQREIPADAYYALVEKTGAGWEVKWISDRVIQGRDNDKQEVLYIDKQFRYVQPFFTVFLQPDAQRKSGWGCSSWRPAEYGPCNSQLTSRVPPIMGFTFVDRNSVAEAVRQSGVIEKIKEKYGLKSEQEER